jgi:hypothetical protein
MIFSSGLMKSAATPNEWHERRSKGEALVTSSRWKG